MKYFEKIGRQLDIRREGGGGGDGGGEQKPTN